jgi:hypothetical protein
MTRPTINTPVRKHLAAWSFSALLAALTALISVPVAAAAPDDIRRIIIEEARETLVPESLALAVAQVESGLRSDRQGANGARGLFQIMPETAADLGTSARKLWQPRENARAGLKMLDGLLDRTEGHWDEALRAYSSRLGNMKSAQVERYVTDVLGWERRFAERLAAQDAVNGRRREILRGHDDWADQAQGREVANAGQDALPTEPEPQYADDAQSDDMTEMQQELLEAQLEAQRNLIEEQRALLEERGEVDPLLDDDTDVEVKVYRGGGNREVEITVYEEEYEVAPPVWYRPPPPRFVQPSRQFSKPFGWRSTQLSRGNRGSGWSPRKAQRLKRRARRQMQRQMRQNRR